MTSEARKVLAVVARRWSDYTRERRFGILAQLVWEIRWDGPKNRFKILLDETAVEETYRVLIAQEWEDADRRGKTRSARRPGRPRARGG